MVHLYITDVRGTVVKELISQQFIPGRYQSFWDGRNNSGVKLPAGVYVANLLIDNERMKEVKMILET